MLKINNLGAIAALLLAPVVVAEELSTSGEFLDGVAAIVNEGVVLKSQLQAETASIIKRATGQGITLPPAGELREQLLERLILTEIQLQRADMIGLRISDAMLNDSIGRIAAQNNVAFEDMPTLLAEDDIDYAAFRRDMRNEITLEQLRRIDVGQRINVSPREIEQCIANIEGNVTINSDYELSHILISMPESATVAQIQEAQGKVDDIHARLLDGADFSALAIRYSDAQTALEGGSLGWLKGEQLPTLYTDIVAEMQAGDVSEPFRTTSSFHIVKVNDMRSAVQRSEVDQVKLRHILVTPNEIIDDQTAKQRLNDALLKIQDGEDFGELAKLLSDDPGSKNDGGRMDWTGPGVFVPEFETVVNDTDIGEISEPFQSRFGWHIVEVLERRMYDNTEDLKEDNCDLRIRNGKMEEETQLWMQRLRDEAFVDIRS